jgi:hypothetical protein
MSNDSLVARSHSHNNSIIEISSSFVKDNADNRTKGSKTIELYQSSLSTKIQFQKQILVVLTKLNVHARNFSNSLEHCFGTTEHEYLFEGIIYTTLTKSSSTDFREASFDGSSLMGR